MRHALNRALFALFSSLLLASCDDALRLVVVSSPGTESVSGAGNGSAMGGTEAGRPSGGASGQAGTNAQGGSAGLPSGGGSPDSGGEPPAGAAGAGGASDDPWDAEPLYRASFSSHAFPGQYIRHFEGEGFIATIDETSMIETEDATFDMIPGVLDDTCETFRSINVAGGMLRHANSRIFLHPGRDDALLLEDATFCLEPGMADPNGFTFRAFNYPQRVIHVRNQNELWIDDKVLGDPTFASESTFYRDAPLTESE